ncbi:DUF1844 domain-containing protein [Edaphobacter albus]|uniref:DUF1844 domain-containing protein n=1 Tax=Edaphobacter sp. 4G125 TaxID=2763071 RepID=UPI0016465006|nr:DUF1844 domain-containing protein [Edaphobacter sp. 4G125]QNI37594.1 DUF1844 domain-containing protein [Edaphobacter sp. 4G125]
MSEQNKPFVITDRRKFNLDGEPRADISPEPERDEHEAAQTSGPIEVPTSAQASESETEHTSDDDLQDLPPGPTAEQTEQSRAAYEATAERLDTAIRAANPGADHPPAMTFETLVQSIYMTTIVQLGGATPEGQQPQVDLMGARQSIDMLGILEEKTKGNLSDSEHRLLESALFELRMAFLEITQALARSASAKTPNPTPGKPSIVR